ncbi:MAG TPA: YidB family protein [Steroidobacteraceae bacterium]|jgi:uncharacterized protein YidB (DUF937 family)|nr:YidB family protein [Steroidobacteraceae bacterium]
MGLMDGILGGVIGAGLTTALQGFIEKQGGLPVVVAQFEQKGLGGLVQSWIGKGANQPVSAAQLQQVLGPDLVQQLAAKTGMAPADMLQKLAKVLPQAVDNMTPDGVIPKT